MPVGDAFAEFTAEGVRVDMETGEIVDGSDDLLDGVLADVSTDTSEELQKALRGGEKPSDPTFPIVASRSPQGASEAVPAGSGGGRKPVGERVTRQAEKAGFGEETPKRGRPATGLAYQGKPATIPERPDAAIKRSSRIAAWMEGYSPFEKDFHDLMEINREVGMVSRAMMEVERLYGEFASYERELNSRYEAAKSRAMVEVSGSSEKTRTAYAEILVEDMRMELDEIRLEVTRCERAQRMLSRHLDALTIIANNLRAGFKVI